jgi:iron complex transport system substrate-binding protein
LWRIGREDGLERLGIRVETFGIATNLAENEAQVKRLAAITGNPDIGAPLLAVTETALAAAPPDGAKVDALLWQEGGIVPGEHTLIAQLLDHAGFASHSAARGLGQGSYVPLEQVLADRAKPPTVDTTA